MDKLRPLRPPLKLSSEDLRGLKRFNESCIDGVLPFNLRVQEHKESGLVHVAGLETHKVCRLV